MATSVKFVAALLKPACAKPINKFNILYFITVWQGEYPDIQMSIYECWNFNFGNAAVTFDTAHLQSSYFHRPSMYSPKLCRTRSQR